MRNFKVKKMILFGDIVTKIEDEIQQREIY